MNRVLKTTAKIILASISIYLPIEGAFCQTPAGKIEIYSKSIPFRSADSLDEYNVSGLWFPQGVIPFGGLSGPAIFILNNVKSGKQWTIAVNAIALLDKDFWNAHQINNSTQLEPRVLVEKLTGFGVIPISLSQDKRARIINCKPSEKDSPPPKARADQCLELGDAIVDLQDVDFDRKKEFVFKHAGVGQRSGSAYEIVRIPEDSDDVLEQAGDSREPFRDIDWRTVINITRKQIILNGSNGACNSTEETYSRTAQGGMSMTHFWRTIMLSTNECASQDYAVAKELDGIGQRFKLLSQKMLE